MSKYNEEETYIAYLTRHENNKNNKNLQQNQQEYSTANKNQTIATNEPSKLDYLITKIEYLTAKIDSIHTHLGLDVGLD
jgi:hypothetical protein